MSGTINAMLEKISEAERSSGLMSVFMKLSKEEQIALLEWSRSLCMQLAAMMERQAVLRAASRNEPVDLPAAKLYVEIALKAGIIRGLMTNNEGLVTGCEHLHHATLGDAKSKSLEDFKDNVLLYIQMSKW